MVRTGALRRLLLAGSIVWCGLAAAGGGPGASPPLPSLSPPGVEPAGTALPSPLSWAFQQRFDWDAASGQGRLSLSPSVSVTVHDPRSAPEAELLQLQHLLDAQTETDDAAERALLAHRLYLRLQHLSAFTELLEAWHASLASLAGHDERHRLELAGLELQLQQLEAEGGLLLLHLEQAGVAPLPPGDPPRGPTVRFPAEPVSVCFANSTTLERLGLLEQLELQEAELLAAGRKMRVAAGAGVNVTLNGAGAPGGPGSATFDVSFVFSRADYAGPHIRLEADGRGFSQSLSLRSEAPARPPAAAGSPYPAMRSGEMLRLLGLFDSLTAAAAREDLAAAGAELEFLELEREGRPTREQLRQAFTAALEHLQAAAEHDSLLLEVAAACRFPFGWEAQAALRGR